MSGTFFHPELGTVSIERVLVDGRAIVLIHATGEAAFVRLDSLTMALEAA